MAITFRSAIMISLIHALWGGNPVAVKFGLQVFPPLWSGFLRFSIAILCILIWARFKGIPMMLKREELRPFSILSFIFFIQIWLMNAGFEISSGAISSVLISTFPLFAAFFSHVMIKGDQLTLLRTLGLAIAFSGTSLIVMRRGGLSVEEFSVWGAAIVLLQCNAAWVPTDPLRTDGPADRADPGGGLDDDSCPLGFYAGWINLRGNPLGETGLASPCRNSLPGGGDRRIRIHGDGTALQILQPDPGFQLRFHFPGLRRAVVRLAAP